MACHVRDDVAPALFAVLIPHCRALHENRAQRRTFTRGETWHAMPAMMPGTHYLPF
jgi:hypothetical protein